MPLHTTLVSMLDPRGRCNRKGLLIAAIVMLSIDIAAGLGLWASGRRLDDPLVMPLKAALIYLAISAAAQRLHDLGHSAWAMLWAMLGLVGWSVVLGITVILQVPPEKMAVGETGHLIVLTGIALPLLGLLLWMHFAAGMTGANRFGPEPSGLGFSRRPSQPREVPAPIEAAEALPSPAQMPAQYLRAA